MNSYWRIIVRSIGLGLFAGVFGLIYLALVRTGTDALWGDWETPGLFSGTWQVMVIPIAAGLLVGIIYKVFRLPPRFEGFITELQEGHVDPRTAPGAVGIALVSLIGGASLGPEAPLGTAGGAAGTWLARRRGEDAEGVRQSSFVGISAMFGGLLSTPIGGPLLAFELEHEQTNAYYFRHLVPGMISGAVAFGVMWPVIGAPFEGLIDIEHGAFESWMLVAAAAIGVIAFLAALVVGKIMLGAVSVMRHLDERPVVRGLVGGAVVGVTAFALPLTLFSGDHSLSAILGNLESFGLPMLIALALVKAIALGASLGGGFYGGPIFPLFFIGGVLGIAVNVVFPAIPLGLAVGATMAGLGAAVSLLPLSMAILVAILTNSGLVVSSAIVVAAATAFALRQMVMRPGEGSSTEAAVAAEAV
jgi:H+/Cl- antiporter ClcA